MVAYFSSPSGAADSRARDRKSAGSHYTEPSKHAAAVLTDNVFTCAAAMLEAWAHACVCTDTQTQLENVVIKFMWQTINVKGMFKIKPCQHCFVFVCFFNSI